jgi:hypothetical protein
MKEGFMTEVVLPPVETTRRFRFDWVLGVLFRPRRTLAQIMTQTTGVWLLPLLILTLTALLQVAAAGPVKQAAAVSGQTVPPMFEYYTPEQQAQMLQALEATSGPVFIYVFPALVSVSAIWIGWLAVSGLMHLILTLLGGRGDTGSALNLVAWASLPLAIRDLVRAGSLVFGKRLIENPGLSGFAPTGDSDLALFLIALLGLVDIYVIWQGILLVIGARSGNGISIAKALSAVLITLLLVLLFQALVGFGIAKLSSLTIIRPFF